ncbi:hypothetical protein [Ferroplasma acidiphilum]|uniref:hypothetical protein n=1 Tax=Ferroplasma acidiphilum TaxID=74969 RepID=UPI002815783D|nr:hypothetical protein [Ferroplasma acidiphilum]WMT52528.1 MAG: hypothetical protein RE473_05830 [Ferroplasma acidiphilum]
MYFFLIYGKYLPELSTKKSVLFSTVITLTILILLDYPLYDIYLLTTKDMFPLGIAGLIIVYLNISVIIGFASLLIIYITLDNYKAALKIGELTSVVLFLYMNLSAFIFLAP